MVRASILGIVASLLMPAATWADDPGAFPLQVHPLATIPFAGLLLAIAILPLIAGHFWHSNLRKLLVSFAFSLPVLLYLLYLDQQGEPGIHRLEESLREYAEFMVLLGSLYTVCGGIVLRGYLRPGVGSNAAILLIGAVLANVIGTTGASMLLVRPMLRVNAGRTRNRHIPVFFIFIVSNLGGLLTPLGDPPLFLGFLRGVPFSWTLSLWLHWTVAVGVVLAVFIVWDAIAFFREPAAKPTDLVETPTAEPLRLVGLHNFVLLAGILVTVLLHSPQVAATFNIAPIHRPWGSALLLGLSVLSFLTTSRALRRENDFAWGAIIEVAVLFVGIFVTMVPALALLERIDGRQLGLDAPWTYFWLTGILSSFLDNAPTYLTFATIAAEGQPFAFLAANKPAILQAISVGAVFMGANTYIGNGPNFMVKAIADASGYRTPSFFGYMVYSGLILIPTFALITFLFFPP